MGSLLLNTLGLTTVTLGIHAKRNSYTVYGILSTIFYFSIRRADPGEWTAVPEPVDPPTLLVRALRRSPHLQLHHAPTLSRGDGVRDDLLEPGLTGQRQRSLWGRP